MFMATNRPHSESNDFHTLRVAVTFTTTLGGLFAIVRGFDNIGRRVRERKRRSALARAGR